MSAQLRAVVLRSFIHYWQGHPSNITCDRRAEQIAVSIKTMATFRRTSPFSLVHCQWLAIKLVIAAAFICPCRFERTRLHALAECPSTAHPLCVYPDPSSGWVSESVCKRFIPRTPTLMLMLNYTETTAKNEKRFNSAVPPFMPMVYIYCNVLVSEVLY